MIAGAWDSHAHVFGDPVKFPLAPERSYTPPQRTIDMLEAAARPFGIEHLVLVQPSVYGMDHALLLDSLAAGGGRHRAVAALDPGISAPEIEALHRAGVRGVRFNLVLPGGSTFEHFATLAAKVARFGWHAQAFVHAATLPAIAQLLASSPIPIVLDHFGSVRPGDAAQAQLLALARHPKLWIKLSGFYRLAPSMADLRPLAAQLVEVAGDRLVWGSDWPHTWFFEPGRGMAPAYSEILEVLPLTRALALDNPERLYR